MQTENQRERLVELITEFEINGKVRCPKYAEPTCDGCEYDLGDECDKTSILADYLIANNVVVLPCKVQDIVYVLTTDSPTGIEETKISKVLVSVKQNAKMSYTVYAPCVYDDWGKAKWSFSDKDFGKTVFLSREEAEAKLKEMQNGT